MLRPGPIATAVLRACGWGGVLLGSLCGAAQQNQTPVFTLKVYANLVQVPTLVLGYDRAALPRIDAKRFLVSLDSGKKFAPTRVRMEGDDPLDIAILLDVRGSDRELIAGFANAAAKMAADSLHAQDQVTIYAVDCNLVRSARDVPAQPDLIRSVVEGALGAPGLKDGYRRGKCSIETPMWQSIVRIVEEMSGSPKRRVLLVVSGGDLPGKISLEEIHHFAAAEGVAIFGMNDRGGIVRELWGRDHMDPFRSLCESTGGIVMFTPPDELEKRLKQWVTLLRDRYVVEFPMPQHLGEGSHDIQVSIKRDDMAFVSLAGVSVSLPDPGLAADPHFVPSQAGADIPVGTRRPLTH